MIFDSERPHHRTGEAQQQQPLPLQGQTDEPVTGGRDHQRDEEHWLPTETVGQRPDHGRAEELSHGIKGQQDAQHGGALGRGRTRGEKTAALMHQHGDK